MYDPILDALRRGAVTEALERTAEQVATALDGLENGGALPQTTVFERKSAPRTRRQKAASAETPALVG